MGLSHGQSGSNSQKPFNGISASFCNEPERVGKASLVQHDIKLDDPTPVEELY